MRNLKRALSLALASVMLLGMMVVGSSAAAFADEADVVNKEAVTITAGLGLFAGTDGKFNPKDTVTRAQMATIIVKMLYGSEINADQFKGAGSFSDTVAFEGGWAEGYINLCASLKVVSGYGDGTFKPGQAVTTAEAVTMIINALKVDAGEGTWPMTVMAAAETMKLFEDLAVKPGTNEALSRDALAGIVLNGLNYSPSDTNTYTYTTPAGKVFEFSSLTAALQSVGIDNADNIDISPAEDTLMKTVFEATTADAYIVGNQATGLEYTELSNGLWLNLETGLDMIGHYVKAYYAEEYVDEDEPGIAYCVVEEAEYIKVAEATTTKKEYTAAFGSTKDLTPAEGATPVYFNGNYVVDAEGEFEYNYGTWAADAGTYVIGDDNTIIAYIAPASIYADKVESINTRVGNESITLVGARKINNNETEDKIVEYDGIAEEDYVTYVKIGTGADAIYNLTKAASVQGQITRTFTDADENVCIVVNGTTYVQKTFADNDTGLATSITDWEDTYTVYLTAEGEWIGIEGVTGAANVSDVYYVVGTYVVDSTNSYGIPDYTTYAQAIDMEGKETQIIVDIDSLTDAGDFAEADETDLDPVDPVVGKTDAQAGLYTFEKATGKAGRSGVMVATALTTTVADEEGEIYNATLDYTTLDSNAFSSKTTEVEVGGDYAFLTANTKFIVIEDNMGSALETAVTTGTITKTLSKDAEMILSLDADDNKIVEVVVIVTSDMNVSSEDIIYISADQVAAAANIGAGKVDYSVYMVTDGSVKTGFVADGEYEGGFYTFEYDATESVYTLYPTSAEKVGVEYKGVINGKLRTDDMPQGYDVAEGAYIVDTRAAKEIEDSETCDYAIETLADLKAAAKDHTITLDLFLNDDEEIEAIFVKTVVENVEA